MKKLNRDYILYCLADADFRKALSFAIFIKTIKGTSVVKNWSYKELQRLTGLSNNTCRKRVATLRRYALVTEFSRKGRNYLKFRNLRHDAIVTRKGVKRTYDLQNSDISRLDFSSTKTIELGLRAMFIYETQKRKDWYMQATIEQTPLRVLKSIKKKLRGRSISSISDNGISYNYIARKTGAGRNTVTRIIKYGEDLKLFTKKHQDWICKFVGVDKGCEASQYLPCSFYTRSNLYIQPANKFMNVTSIAQCI